MLKEFKEFAMRGNVVDMDFFCYFVEERNDVWPHPD